MHNGIIENYAPLRAELESLGVDFNSDTDTETAVHSLQRAYSSGETAGDFVASAYAVLRRLEGAFTWSSPMPTTPTPSSPRAGRHRWWSALATVRCSSAPT